MSARGPSGQRELEQFIQEEWDAIPMASVNSLVLSFRKRLRDVSKAQGHETGM